MSWNYRVIEYKDGSGFGLHEVFYDDNGQPWGMTEDAIRFVSNKDEGPKGIAKSLMMARTDVRLRPVLKQPDEWPGKAP
jgi:hypothetical protein